MLYCKKCDIYTLKENCPKCKQKTMSNKPAKFSIEDKYGKYRRIAKKVYKE
ncbi:MAG: RNA-protein complex protein Nop10 [Candidatus Nanoarchaeia archaeon]|nr:RNA-protein complex protein Nop10 [Candidatus Nanoarchaeia archaeon]